MKTRMTAIALAALLLGAATGVHADDRTYVAPRTAADEGAPPFSGGVMIDDILHVSGNLGLVDGKVPEDPTDEARAVMEAIKGTVEAAGLTMDDIFLTQVYCSDVAHYGAFNEVYRTYFTREFPARAFLGSGPLLFDARFEVMVTAKKRDD